MKQKMDIEKKVKLIYSGEFIIIALILLVVGVLKLTGVIETKPTRLLIYNIITIAGAVWFVIDLIWALNSPKRRKTVFIVDKVLIMPASAYLLFFDIWCIVYRIKGWEVNDLFIKISVGSVLLYIGVLYIFLGIYHYKYPLPSLMEAIEEAKKEEEEKNNQPQEEQELKEEAENKTNDEDL